MYRNVYILVYYLNNMERLINNPINMRKMRKKISLNVNVALLDLIRDLAKLTKTNNTLVIESLLVKGVYPLFQTFKEGWASALVSTKDKDKKERVQNLLNELKKIKKKRETQVLMGIGDY